MTPTELAKRIDHTTLKSEATEDDVCRIVGEALEYEFASVCVSSIFVRHVSQRLAGDAFHDPADQLGVDGFISKRLAVFAFLFKRQQKVIQVVRPTEAFAPGAKTSGAGIVPKLSLGV